MRRSPRTTTLVCTLAATLCAAGPAASALAETGGASAAPSPASTSPARGLTKALATWFGPGFYGQTTACGQLLEPATIGVANRTLPCGTLVRVSYHRHRLVVPVIDRGPYAHNEMNHDTNAHAHLRAAIVGPSETIPVVGRELKVEYTPGHASHHVSYLDTSSRVAFVGDTAGIRRGSGAFVMPPTPPPDIDLVAWRESERKILAWEPDTLFLTHFGPYHGARPHLQAMFETLAEWNRIVRRLLADARATDEDRQARFVDEAFQDLRRRLGDTEAADYTKAGGLNFSYNGLARYWRKRAP